MKELLREQPFRCLLLLAVVPRMVVPYFYHPVIFADSPSYLEYAAQIVRFDLSGDIGFRTPVYPLFLTLLNSDPRWIYLAQSLMGIAISSLIYLIFREVSGKKSIALMCGSAYALNPSSLLYEATVMTEVLTAFLVVLSVWLATQLIRGDQLEPRAAFWLALVASLAGLTKPTFQLLPIVLFVVLILIVVRRGRLKTSMAAVAGIATLLPFVVIILGWSTVNKMRFGQFAVTTQAGYGLSNHSGKFIEFAPAEYKPLTDIYLAERRIKGHNAGVIFKAAPRIAEATGLSAPEISREFVKLSLYLFVHHPILYAKSVGQSLILFFFPAPNYDGYRLSSFIAFTEPLWVYVYALAYLTLEMAFGICLCLLAFRVNLRKRLWSADLTIFMAILLYTACVSSAMEFADTARYKFPVEGLLLAWALYLTYAVALSTYRADSTAGSMRVRSSPLSLGAAE